MSNAPCEMFRCLAGTRKSAVPGSDVISTPNLSGGVMAAGASTASTTDPYILTLCRLDGPVTIRPPRAPEFKPFTFFTSRCVQADGSEQLFLQMGYFATPEQAKKWKRLLRRVYPQAIAMRAPAALLQQRDSAVPTLRPAISTRASDNVLTDTQVFGVLDSGRAPSPAPVAERTLAPRTPSNAKSEGTNSRPVDASPRPEESIEETLEMLAASDMWADADSVSETGVRHLQVDVQKRKSQRS